MAEDVTKNKQIDVTKVTNSSRFWEHCWAGCSMVPFCGSEADVFGHDHEAPKL